MHLGNCLSILAILAIALSSDPVVAHDPAAGMDADKPEIRATRINGDAPAIDGHLDDADWNNPQLDLARDFKQIRPDDGQLLTESTLVAVIYDDDAMYFAFWCYDSEPEKIARQMVRRDRFGEADLIAIRLDPYHDHQNGYDFYVNATGVQCDMRLYNDGNSDEAWNGVAYISASVFWIAFNSASVMPQIPAATSSISDSRRAISSDFFASAAA